jgi:2-polyprenyl-3-methyl-5-hydroxy-6-metoxy-1,4-benzoquinol methylase
MAVARYDEVADFYAAGWTDACDDPATAALLELVASPAGLRILDVACGHGRVTRELARRGADVTGMDISRALLDKASRAEQSQPLRIAYRRADLTTGALPNAGRFDLVTCNFGLSDVDDLSPALQAIADALRPGGRFVFSILHPCFPGGGEVSGAWSADSRYGDEGYWVPRGTESSLRRRVGATHRKLSTYLNALIDSGFVIDRLIEPDPGPGWAGGRAAAARYPVYLAVAATLARPCAVVT